MESVPRVRRWNLVEKRGQTERSCQEKGGRHRPFGLRRVSPTISQVGLLILISASAFGRTTQAEAFTAYACQPNRHPTGCTRVPERSGGEQPTTSLAKATQQCPESRRKAEKEGRCHGYQEEKLGSLVWSNAAALHQGIGKICTRNGKYPEGDRFPSEGTCRRAVSPVDFSIHLHHADSDGGGGEEGRHGRVVSPSSPERIARVAANSGLCGPAENEGLFGTNRTALEAHRSARNTWADRTRRSISASGTGTKVESPMARDESRGIQTALGQDDNSNATGCHLQERSELKQQSIRSQAISNGTLWVGVAEQVSKDRRGSRQPTTGSRSHRDCYPGSDNTYGSGASDSVIGELFQEESSQDPFVIYARPFRQILWLLCSSTVTIHWKHVVAFIVSIPFELEWILSAILFQFRELPQDSCSKCMIFGIAETGMGCFVLESVNACAITSSSMRKWFDDDFFDFVSNFSDVIRGAFYLLGLQLLMWLCVLGLFFATMLFFKTRPRKFLQKVRKRRLSIRKVCHRNRRARGILFALLVLAQESTSVAATLNKNTQELQDLPNSEPNADLTREIQLHWMKGPLKVFDLPLNVAFHTYREIFGRVLQLDEDLDTWNRFLIHKVIPRPTTENLFGWHYIVETPKDKQEHESLVLIDLFYFGEATPFHRTVFPVHSDTTSAAFISQIGLDEVCYQNAGKRCVLWHGDLPWNLYEPTFRNVFDGTYFRVIISDLHCEPSSNEVMSNETDDSHTSDHLALMQTDLRYPWLGADKVRGLLLGRSSYLRIPIDRGFCVYAWFFTNTLPQVQRTLRRVWLEPKQHSWTSRLCEEFQGQDFHIEPGVFLVQPLPPHLFVAAHRVHLLVQTCTNLDGMIAILVDVWLHSSPLRLALQFESGTTLRGLLRLTFGGRPFPEQTKMYWETADGVIIFDLDQTVELPSGAYVEIHAHEQCETDVMSFFETHTLPKRGREEMPTPSMASNATSTANCDIECDHPAENLTPLRTVDEEQMLDTILQSLSPHDEFIQIISIGLGIEDLGERNTMIGFLEAADPLLLRQKISRLWSDVFTYFAPPYDLYFLRPQPESETMTLHFLVDFIPAARGAPFVIKLEHIDQSAAAITRELHAHRVREFLSTDDAAEICRLPMGWRELGYRCSLQYDGHQLGLAQVYRVHSGNFYKLIATLVIPYEPHDAFTAGDEHSLFQPYRPSWLSTMTSKYQSDVPSHSQTYFSEEGVNLVQIEAVLSPRATLVEQIIGRFERRRQLHFLVWFLCSRTGQWRSQRPTRVFSEQRHQWRIDWEQLFPVVDGIQFSLLEVRPKPNAEANMVGADAYLIFHSDMMSYSPFLVDIDTPFVRKRLATYLHSRQGTLDSGAVFTILVPDNQCATSSWCKIIYGTQEVDWPRNFNPRPVTWLHLVEIAPDPVEEDQESLPSTDFCSSQEGVSEGESDDYVGLLQLQSFICPTPTNHDGEIFVGFLNPTKEPQRFCQVDETCSLLQGQCAIFVFEDYCVRRWPRPFEADWAVRASFIHLRPPGNPVKRAEECPTLNVAKDFESLDDVSYLGRLHIIFDFCAAPVKIPISLEQALQEDMHQPKVSPREICLRLPELQGICEIIFGAFSCAWPNMADVEELLPIPTLLYLNELHLSTLEQCEKLEIYTDGSYSDDSDTAGWAFVVFGSQNGVRTKVHAACGPLRCSTDTFAGTGADRQGSRPAETEALIMAIIWRISSSFANMVDFCFDSMTTGFPTAGHWNFQPTSVHLRVARSLAQFAEVFAPKTNCYRHVRAHKGVHGNELADVLAKCGRFMDKPVGFPIIDFGEAISQQPLSIEWLWLALKATESTILPDCYGNSLKFSTNCTKASWSRSFPEELISQRTEGVLLKKSFEIGLLTYNVQSIQADAKPFRLGVHALLREQLQSHAIHLAFLQETRSKQSGLFVSNTHYRCVAKADQGRGGTEVWILRSKQGQSRQLLAKQQISVLFEHAELLVVRLTLYNNTYVVVSGHAPHSAKPRDEIHCWWSMLEEQMRKAAGQGHFLLGIDANAHFGEPHPPHLGEHGLEEATNENARCLYRICSSFSFSSPHLLNGCILETRTPGGDQPIHNQRVVTTSAHLCFGMKQRLNQWYSIQSTLVAVFMIIPHWQLGSALLARFLSINPNRPWTVKDSEEPQQMIFRPWKTPSRLFLGRLMCTNMHSNLHQLCLHGLSPIFQSRNRHQRGDIFQMRPGLSGNGDCMFRSKFAAPLTYCRCIMVLLL